MFPLKLSPQTPPRQALCSPAAQPRSAPSRGVPQPKPSADDFSPAQRCNQGFLGAFDERGNKVRLGLSADHSTLKKRSRIRLELVLRQDWHYKTGCLIVPDLTPLLTKIRTLIHEEISLPWPTLFPLSSNDPSYCKGSKRNRQRRLSTKSSMFFRLRARTSQGSPFLSAERC